VFVRSLAPCDTYFLKILKIFSFLLVFVRSFASCDTIFQIISKTPKKYKNFKNTKYQHFQAKKSFLELCDSWFSTVRYVGERSVLVRFTSKKSNHFPNSFSNIFLRTTWSLILHCEICRSKASPCQVHLQKIKSCFQISFKELCNPDFSFLMRIRRTKVNPCRAQKTIKNIFVSF